MEMTTQARFRLYKNPLSRDHSVFSYMINKGLSNVPTTCANKAETGLCQQKNSITTTEAAQLWQHALVLIACIIIVHSLWVRDHAHCNGFITR